MNANQNALQILADRTSTLSSVLQALKVLEAAKPMPNAHIIEVREKMGLKNTGRIPADFTFEGTVTLEGAPASACQLSKDRSRYLKGSFLVTCAKSNLQGTRSRRGMKHRVRICCPFCAEMIPSGRFNQHNRVCYLSRGRYLVQCLSRPEGTPLKNPACSYLTNYKQAADKQASILRQEGFSFVRIIDQNEEG